MEACRAEGDTIGDGVRPPEVCVVGTVRCGQCGAENPEAPGGASFFCQACKAIVDPSGRRRPSTPMPGPARDPSRREEKSSFVSQYHTMTPRETAGPGAGFAVGGVRPLGYLLAAVAAALVAGGLGWVGLHYVSVPLVFSLVAGWATKRALAAGCGGGTPDRGPLGILVLLAIVVSAFGAGRYLEYLATAERESRHVDAVLGPAPTADPDAVLRDLYQLDPDKDGLVTIPADGSTVRLADEEQRLRAAVATGVRPADGYDVTLLASTGRRGFVGHVQHVLGNGTSFHFTPRGRAFPLPGYGVVLWWLAELLVLTVAAFTRVD